MALVIYCALEIYDKLFFVFIKKVGYCLVKKTILYSKQLSIFNEFNLTFHLQQILILRVFMWREAKQFNVSK